MRWGRGSGLGSCFYLLLVSIRSVGRYNLPSSSMMKTLEGFGDEESTIGGVSSTTSKTSLSSKAISSSNTGRSAHASV